MLSKIKDLEAEDHRYWIKNILVYKDKLISCSTGPGIKFWDLKGEDVTYTQTLIGHSNTVMYILVYKNKLISCSWDKTIKIWDLNLNLSGKGENIKLIKTLEGHSDTINYMFIYKDKLISCSWDKTIKIWDIEGENTEPIRTLADFDNTHVVYLVVYKNKLIVSLFDETIKILDLDDENYRVIKMWKGHENRAIHMVIYQDKLISSSCKTIKIWDLNLSGKEEDTQPIITLEGHKNWIVFMSIYKDKLISCSDDGVINIWSLKGDDLYKCLETYNIRVDKLTFYGGYLYACLASEIKILKYQPYFEDYQNAVRTISKIMNSSCISYQNKLYKGSFYKREVNLVMSQLDIYNNKISSINKISSN